MTTEQNSPEQNPLQKSQSESKGGVWLWAGIAALAFAGAGARILSAEPAAKANPKTDAECEEIAAGKKQADAFQQLACTSIHGFSLHMR